MQNETVERDAATWHSRETSQLEKPCKKCRPRNTNEGNFYKVQERVEKMGCLLLKTKLNLCTLHHHARLFTSSASANSGI